MERKKSAKIVHNAFYEQLNEKSHTSSDYPVALLRAAHALRNPWIQAVLVQTFYHPAQILDVGCGEGDLANFLATKGHFVSGIDLSSPRLDTAKKTDVTQSVNYQRADAKALSFAGQSFDVVCAMDLLEHVEQPALVVAEAARVLKKGGLFFFHTFNRNLLSYFMVVKGMDWCCSRAPKNMHAYPLFIKPSELTDMCIEHTLSIREIRGMRPAFSSKSFWKMVLTRRMDEHVRFIFTSSLKIGYTGLASKDG